MKPSAKTLRLAHDVAFRLGCEVEIQAKFTGSEESCAFALPNLTMEQLRNAVDWLDYYVPTLDEENAQQYGPMHSDGPELGRPRGAKGPAPKPSPLLERCSAPA